MKAPAQEISFETAYMKYCNVLISNCNAYGVQNRHDAEEIVDDIFALLYTKWNTLESHAEAVVLKWLHSTLKNTAYNYVRKRNRQLKMFAEAERDASLLRAEKEHTYSDEEYRQLIETLYKTMNESEITLFECVVNENMTLSTVSVLTEENINTVKSRWLRLRKKLEKLVFKKK